MNSAFSHSETNKNFSYEGFLYQKEEIESIFPNQIKDKLLDSEGTNEIINQLANLEDLKSTGFNDIWLFDVLGLDDVITKHEDWRIGEAFAEFHLEDCHSCRFYYNELRDARNVHGNKTGADLLGFIELDGETIFLFGEVKTSNEKKYPPQVLYSRHGMVDQLKDLATNPKTRKTLVRYLGFKVKDLDITNPFKADFVKAFKNYSLNRFSLVGILIRDTDSNENDLKARYKALRKSISATGLKMLALYIPIKMGDWNNLVRK
jgi:hypothetical protein